MSREEVRNDLQQPRREDHKLERAIQRVRVYYVEAMHTSQIHNPIAWALYKAWQEIELTEVRPR